MSFAVVINLSLGIPGGQQVCSVSAVYSCCFVKTDTSKLGTISSSTTA